MQQVGVHLLQSNAEFDNEYTYLVDESLIEKGEIIRGSFVDVPFGTRKSVELAVVSSIGGKYIPGSVEYTVKEISGVSDIRPPLSKIEMEAAYEMSKRYYCPLGPCVKCFVPPKASKGRPVSYAHLIISPAEVDELAQNGTLKNISHIKALELLKDGREKVSEIVRIVGCTKYAIDTLAKKGYIKIEKAPDINGKINADKIESSMPTYNEHVLNEEQKNVFDFVVNLIQKNKYSESLIHGVTGSGKTEIYMQLISKVIRENGSAILLVPEISLTPQMTAHFNNRFGDKVAVLHSRLSDTQRNLQWQRIKNAEVSVAIGARSAIFAPFENLKLIILDEEHEASYSSEESMPHYHAAEIAEIIAQKHNAAVIYGSATPKIETFYRAINKEINYLPLKKRANQGSMPEIIIEDMLEARRNGRVHENGIFSKRLVSELEKNLKQGKQSMIFVHRRGYSGQLMCRSCGKTMKCSRCDLPLTYHERGNRLICHHCGRTAPAPLNCPICNGKDFDKRGIGTQRVVEELKNILPGVNILRMDTDTTSVKDGHENILKAFAAHEADILVGTQMIAKGHDFPDVTLVGIISADSLVNMPDFKAQERAFQLLTQMAGRAGRADTSGKVIIQAYNVDDYAITSASKHDYEEFYRNEILVRENLNNPPFSSLGIIRISGIQDRETYGFSYELCGKIKELGIHDLEVCGPARADVPKVNNKYRWIINLKAAERSIIIDALERLFTDKKYKRKLKGNISMTINFIGR